MEDLLSFLTGNLKQKGMTVNEFCSQIGISRQKFYRFAKEPRRFTEENLRAIKEVLQLNESDAGLLNTFFSNRQSGAGTADHSCYRTLIADLFGRCPSEELSVKMYNIEYYNNTSDSATMQSPDSIARILAAPCRKESGQAGESARSGAQKHIHHEYAFTIYNCTPRGTESDSMSFSVSKKSLLTIALIINEIRKVSDPHDESLIRVRHYLSDDQRKMLLNENIDDQKAVTYNLQLLNSILPILSTVADYSIDRTEIARQYWTDHSNICLIEHQCSPLSYEEPEAGGSGQAASGMVFSEYYVMLFSNTGACTMCRLGNEEVSYIFRFLSIDTRDKQSLPSEQLPNPNQYFYEIDHDRKIVLIHPDLCFDDVPDKMWTALYQRIQASENKQFFESAFRNLIDPYDQYTFLSFDEIVSAAISTLEKRSELNNRNGRIVICHPKGLQDLARAGMITDLISDDMDYTGKNESGGPIRFPAPMIRDLLKLIRSNIVNRQASPCRDPEKCDCINYYILHPKFQYPEITFIIYKDYGVTALYNYSSQKNLITNIFRNSAVGTLLYEYVISTMICKREKDLDSGILSDEHAISLIDKLLLEVEENGT